MKITAAVAREINAPLSIEEVELDDPRDDEILVKLVATGVCHTDMAVIEGLMGTEFPVVLGHEGAGIVERVGSAVSKVQPGDRVVMTMDSCGQCPACANHDNVYCHNTYPMNFMAQRMDGTRGISKEGERIGSMFFGQSSYATHAVCHEANIVKVPDDVELEKLGPLGCGIQTGAGTVMNALAVEPGRSIVIFGAGGVGLSGVMGAVVQGATTIIVVDMVDSRLELAKELGATHTFNAKTDDVSDEIMKLTGYGVNYAFDTTGNAKVIRQAVELLAPKGTCAIVGASSPEAEIALNETHFMSGGRRLMGVVEGESNPDVFIPTLIALWQQGRFPFDKLITFFPFEQINEAFEASEKGEAIKPILRFA
ncbi:NAD(P)-dependent alcohol dehydrogenase [Allosediminivita pacifica]|uniref:Aryl-alcohol dehydrogenase n=1 Tax=Allosediminivita pacifica TaxID=1267769 RepID=A0A2T6AZU7_9RHOB|nr:NAD(P)-dependent alcohol dehydrogenase [Allosediminivita pacifica]PTX49330.1 aryl-alcohol dehydrogenase [Allosediminivita pacifica]GGB04892.1 aryl-alcohol dehydrogenase [Allosediminivita pacifica]